MADKLYILYDGRAKLDGNTDEASIYVTADSLDEVREYATEECWADGIWYEYDIELDSSPDSVLDGLLHNGKPRWDLPPTNAICPCGEPTALGSRDFCVRCIDDPVHGYRGEDESE